MLKPPANLRPHRTERVISAARLLLAAFLVLALELEGNRPDGEGTPVMPLSLGYLAYAAAIFLVLWSRRTTARFTPAATHSVDLAVFAMLIHLTEGPTSPFFVYFLFAVVCGTLRWHGRGALLTGAAALVLYILVAAATPALLPGEAIERTRFITRCTHLGIITLLLAYFGSYQQRLQTEVASLAAWPRRLPHDAREGLRQVLASAAVILRAPRLVLMWQEAEEPSLRVATWDGTHLGMAHQPPDGNIVAGALERSSFLCADVGAARPYVVQRVPGGFDSWRGTPLDEAFARRHQVKSVLALRLATEDIDGYLFALDRAPLSIDDLLIGDIVGRLVAGALEQQALLLQLRDTAAGEERLRLARDLHDGVLQSLTALGLQAARVRAVALRDPAEAERRMALLEETIAGESRGLRQMLDELHPGRRASLTADADAAGALREVITQLGRRWEVPIEERLGGSSLRVPHPLVQEICRMTEEAVGNAIRHGRARSVSVALVPHGRDGLQLTVSYVGRGFATFTGRHDLAALERMQAGPRSLKERVAALDGDLVIESDDNGARLEIVVSRTADRPRLAQDEGTERRNVDGVETPDAG